jgi:hypothetical protein
MRIIISTALILLTACSAPSPSDEGEETLDGAVAEPDAAMTPQDMVDPPAPTGSIAGRLVNDEGAPIAGLTVLCCDMGICIMGGSDENGDFVCEDLELGPWKMQVADPSGDHVDMVFFQTVESAGPNLPSREIVVTRTTQSPTAWESMTGGEAVLAQGALRLSADPGALSYPVGTRDEAILSQEIPLSALPPYDREPWLEAPERARAFFMDPVHVSSSSPVSLVVATEGETAGNVFLIFSVDPDTGQLNEAGTATVDTQGRLVSDPDSNVTELTALLLVPSP